MRVGGPMRGRQVMSCPLAMLRHGMLRPGQRAPAPPSRTQGAPVVCPMAGSISAGHSRRYCHLLHLLPPLQAPIPEQRLHVFILVLRAPAHLQPGLRRVPLPAPSLLPLRVLPPGASTVTSKPNLYPLVITCGAEGDGKAGNYLMVQYFRNYVIHAPGSLSAASTAESLNSSYLCNAANDANTIVPPPYSCASNYDDCGGGGCGRSLLRSLSSLTEPRAPPPPRARTTPDVSPALHHTQRREATAAFRENLITSPVQALDPSFDLDLDLIDCELYCDGGCKPRLGASPPSHRSPSNLDEDAATPGYEYEAYGLRQLFSSEGAGACESPPQPTSPTQSRDSTLRRPSDENRRRRVEPKKIPRSRKSSLYMPLSVAYPVRTSRKSPGARASSRSAPATPCNPLVPNFLNYAPRVLTSRHSSRSSRCEEESNPLLSEVEHARLDHKF
ncbi:uncharacterized protein LOC128683793 isoform X2 [Plodia interpunctella]|uniref:uncharacterized protein LOC128683793 isoform X2 n=1 Tax=Plodia interpunctella TaxID=58824 RepID=UPI0023689A5B|nr:uncharacterized protein LOC128683793 isoform X2 [Plodia interpunctella]